MNLIASYQEAHAAGSAECGGKAAALGFLQFNGFTVPEGLCLTCRAYRDYIGGTGLGERIMMELNRKPMDKMRWEEVWDAALRIRNMFLRTPLPQELARSLTPLIEEHFGNRPVAVRSSAPGEDSGSGSFAGLHASFVNISGTEAILEHVRLVWASLWSDAALMYRKELKLDVFSASMAVIIQELVHGSVSGVAFSIDPAGGDNAVIEAVYGLNQGLVDGTVQPDRWKVSRKRPLRLEHYPVPRGSMLVPVPGGVRCVPLPPEAAARPPLDDAQVGAVFDQCLSLEKLAGTPQDMEWTINDAGAVVLLQARPITTTGSDPDDKRVWYRSLSRTFDNLKKLRERIEKEIVPGMLQDASQMARLALRELNDQVLAAEIEHRNEVYQKWIKVYWDDLIPFAHGVRLFGQYYNDIVHPENPYEFVDLLGSRDFQSLNRNQKLEELASIIRQDEKLMNSLQQGGEYELFQAFSGKLAQFIEEFGDLTSPLLRRVSGLSAGMRKLLLEMASRPERKRHVTEEDVSRLTARFAMQVPPEQLPQAMEMLELARVSYRLRDDDNVYLHGVEAQLNAAMLEGQRRLRDPARELTAEQICALLCGREKPEAESAPEHSMAVFTEQKPQSGISVTARQLTGQPSSPGLATGRARVITCHEDLAGFCNGDILVCDAISPTMTFVVPLAGAIVERRGGMLIHGAIIAREYGIPCVTGVEDAVSEIKDGANLTVDGFLGIVRVD